MSDTLPQDIEIYVANTPGKAVLDWLKARFPDQGAARPAGKRQWRQLIKYQNHEISVLVIEEASPGFTSVWFDSPHSPWATDLECAREASAHFQQEVRVTAGSWDESADPDAWISLTASGESVIQWPG